MLGGQAQAEPSSHAPWGLLTRGSSLNLLLVPFISSQVCIFFFLLALLTT